MPISLPSFSTAPVWSSMVMVFVPVRSVWSNSSVGPTLPMAAVLKPASRAAFKQGLLVEIVAVELLVDIAQNLIVLDKRHDSAVWLGRLHRVAGIDRVAERAGVAEIVSGRHAGRIGHGEGREQGVGVFEIHALVANLRPSRVRFRASL